MQLNRRSLLVAAAAVGATGWSSRPSFARDKLTGVIYFTPTYKAIIQGARGFVKAFNGASGGDAALELFDSGQLVKADQQLPALRSGNIDMMFHATSYITRTLPILGIVGLPGVVEQLYEHPDRLAMDSPLMKLINAELAKQNLYMPTLGGGILEPQYIWVRKGASISNLADLKGKKVRIAEYEATRAMEKLGVSSVRLTSSEIYLALQRGIVDAAVVNIATVMGRSLQEQLSACYKLPVTAYTVAPFVLLDKWKAMPEGRRQAFLTASKWYDSFLAKTSRDDVYPKYWEQVKAVGVATEAASEQDIAAFGAASKEVRDAWSKEVGEDVGTRAIALAMGKA
ncbi:MAG: TRAP transporter substrate-binding protein DctP [Xanthobacteraceae bacterium]